MVCICLLLLWSSEWPREAKNTPTGFPWKTEVIFFFCHLRHSKMRGSLQWLIWISECFTWQIHHFWFHCVSCSCAASLGFRKHSGEDQSFRKLSEGNYSSCWRAQAEPVWPSVDTGYQRMQIQQLNRVYLFFPGFYFCGGGIQRFACS